MNVEVTFVGSERSGVWLELVTGGDVGVVEKVWAEGRGEALAAVNGVERVRCFHEPHGPRHLLLAELDDVPNAATGLSDFLGAYPPDVYGAPQVRTILATPVPGAVHGIARDGVEGPMKFVVVVVVAEAMEGEFNRWYDAEHIPILLRHEGWLGARRYRVVGPACEYLTVYEVEHTGILDPATRADVRSTEWSRDVLTRVFVTHTRAFFDEARLHLAAVDHA